MLLPVLLALTGCGGEDAPVGQVDVEPGVEATGTGADAQVLPVAATFWHSGFQVEVVEAELSAVSEDATGGSGRQLSVRARFTNEGPEQARFPAEVALVTGGNSHPGLAGELPPVPSGLTTEGSFVFPVAPDVDISTASLVVGRAGENQARVPIGPNGGDLVDLAPRELTLSGELSLELIDLTVTGAELRADLPDIHTELAQGQRSLWLHFDATSRKSGTWTVQNDHFALIAPDGGASAVVGSHLPRMPGDEEGLVTTGMYVRFLVDDPPEGEYTLRFTAPSWFRVRDSDAPVEDTFAFTV